MSGEEASRSKNVIEGTCLLNGIPLKVVSGASHSFIAEACVTRLQLHVHKLPFDLSVVTPGSESIITSRAC